ncbi:MAG: hypothetical protein WHT81_00870, partial [Rectinemataceae bacterium]
AYLVVKGILDIAKLIERLAKELERERAYIEKLDAKLANQAFLSSAPADIIERERLKLAQSREKAAKLARYLQELA